MNDNSDIRTGGRALTAATIICCLFAATATVSALRTRDAVRTHQAAVAKATKKIAVAKSESLPHGPVPNGSGLKQAAAAVTGQITRTVSQGTLAESADDTTMSSVVSATPIGELPTTALDKRGIYVPVTVHPVTVNLDGAAFAEQMGRLADNMGEVLAARPAPMPIDVATLNSVEDRIQVAMRDDRLSQIDANLERLTTKVDALVSESREADSTLNNELQQTVASSQLVDEFRQTLAEHRELLTRQHAEPIQMSRERVAQAQLNDSPSVVFEDAQDVPFPVGWEDEAQQTPQSAVEQDDELLHVPLPPAEEVETSLHSSETTVIAEDWELPIDQPVQTAEPASAPPLDNDSTYNSAESINTDSGLAFYPESLGTDSANEAQGARKHSATEAKPAPVITVRESIRITEPETAADQTPARATTATPEIPVVDIPVAVEPEPVVFEQTVNFAMPPAADPLDGLATSFHQEMKSTAPAVISNPTATTPVVHSNLPRQSASTGRQSTGKRVEGIVVPDQHLTANHRLPDRNQPPRLRPVPRVKHRRQPRANVDGAFDALTDAGGMVTDHTLGLFDRVMQRSKLPRFHSRPRKAPPALHRVGAAIRGVGRSPLVN